MIAFSIPAPSAAVITMARMTVGKASIRSVKRMTTPSTRPPKKPDTVPTKCAQHDREKHRGEADRDRNPGAIDDPAQDVAAERVGAEPVGRRRRLEPVRDVLLEGAVGSDQRGTYRHRQPDADTRQRRHRQAREARPLDHPPPQQGAPPIGGCRRRHAPEDLFEWMVVALSRPRECAGRPGRSRRRPAG